MGEKRVVGRPGVNGKDGISVRLKRDGDDLVAVYSDGREESLGCFKGQSGGDGKRGEPGERGLDGCPGRDGVDGAPGRDGRDGVDGKDGLPGRDGRDGLDGAEGAVGPQGERGADGRDGEKGERGSDGAPGRDGRDGRDGLDAPFSKWISVHEGTGVTGVESASCVVYSGEIATGSVAALSVTVVGRGVRSRYYGKRECLIGDGHRVDSDVVVFNPRRTDPALSFEVRPKASGYEVVVVGLATEEIFWKAEIEQAVL